jgi:OHCU decarboxylase
VHTAGLIEGQSENTARDSMDAIDRLNSISSDEAEAEFLKCCGSQRWAAAMVGERPFRDVNEMATSADRIWWSLTLHDWLEAFRSHPKIGEKKPAAVTSEKSQSWSASEQSGTRDPELQTMDELSRLNREYEQKFGFIYIVCATGKSAEQMLAILRERLSNTRDDELRNAAAEQAKITALRLNKLISDNSS